MKNKFFIAMLDEFDMLLCKADLSEAQVVSYLSSWLKKEIEMYARLFNLVCLQFAYVLANI